MALQLVLGGEDGMLASHPSCKSQTLDPTTFSYSFFVPTAIAGGAMVASVGSVDMPASPTRSWGTMEVLTKRFYCAPTAGRELWGATLDLPASSTRSFWTMLEFRLVLDAQ